MHEQISSSQTERRLARDGRMQTIERQLHMQDEREVVSFNDDAYLNDRETGIPFDEQLALEEAVAQGMDDAELEPRERSVAFLRYRDGYTSSEIAEMLSIEVPAVHAATRKLRSASLFIGRRVFTPFGPTKNSEPESPKQRERPIVVRSIEDMTLGPNN